MRNKKNKVKKNVKKNITPIHHQVNKTATAHGKTIFITNSPLIENPKHLAPTSTNK
jgi:hypothetical protein